MWPINRRQRDRDWDLDRGYWGGDRDVGFGGLGFGGGDLFADVDREFRRMNRQLRRLERDIMGGVGGELGWGPSSALVAPALTFGGVGNQLANIGSLFDRTFPILPNYVDQGGQKLIQFQVDTTGFKPEDISIKTTDGKLVVSGKHEEKSQDFARYREFHRSVALPQGVNLESLKSRLSPDGLLIIEAPYQPPAIEAQQQPQGQELPIQHLGRGEERNMEQTGGKGTEAQQQPADQRQQAA